MRAKTRINLPLKANNFGCLARNATPRIAARSVGFLPMSDSYSVTFNDQAFVVTVVPTPSETEARTEKVGTVRLVPAEYEIQVKPADIRGGELMRLFSISLTPAGNAGTLA